MKNKARQLRNEAAGPDDVERPHPSGTNGAWGSDVVAEVLKRLDIEFVTLNPGASFRGLHDSIVNYGQNRRPQMLVCLHEEHAVSIAHGWAKVTERAMAAIVHSNVGLMHATMAVFNAWCDRAPLLLLGATGPVDAEKRRPWIDWIHTAQDQGALIRSYCKWDDQPASVGAIVESLYRAHMVAETAPRGPTYVCLDSGLQESAIEKLPDIPDAKRFAARPAGEPAPALIEQAAGMLADAKRPVILMGRVSRGEADWKRRVRLAETLGAIVLTDIKAAAAFPSSHPLHAAPSGTFLNERAAGLLAQADAVLSLDWIDLGGTLRTVWGGRDVTAKVIQVSLDHYVHNGWSKDHQRLPPVDCFLPGEPDPAIALLLAALDRKKTAPTQAWRPILANAGAPSPPPAMPAVDEPLTVPGLAAALREAVAGEKTCLIRGPFSWAGNYWMIEHPLDYLGIDGGAGLGSGPGMAVGAALALRGSGRLPISIFGDGDFMMGAAAIWTAVHYRVPLMILVTNNRSFFNDVLHQERMARQRGRLVENKWIGQRISDPDIDLAMVARGQGAVGIGPVENIAALKSALREGIQMVRSGKCVVVDVRVEPGYDPATTSAMTRGAAPIGKPPGGAG